MVEHNNRVHYPLTYPQQRIWYTQLIYPESRLENLSVKIRICAPIHYDLLEAAIQQVIHDNDALRIRFGLNEQEEPYQYFTEFRREPVARLRFRQDIQAAEQWVGRTMEEKFSLFHSPMSQFFIADIHDEEAWVFFKLHHMIADGTSAAHFIDQIVDNYAAFLGGSGKIGKRYPSYAEFIDAEAQYFESSRYEKDLKYWTERLADIPDLCGLKPYDLFAVSTKAARQRYVLEPREAERIREFCHANQISMYNLFMAVLSIYLSKMTLMNDIVIGTNLTNRTNAKEKMTPGMFTGTLPFRTEVDHQDTFHTHLQRVMKDQMALIRHQRYPYNLLIQQLREKDRDLSRLFSISLLYQRIVVTKREEFHHETHYMFSGHEIDDFGIHVKEWTENNQITIDYEYRSEIFTLEEIETIHRHYYHLLLDCISRPSNAIGSMQLVTPVERQQLLRHFQGEQRDIDEETAAERFERQAEAAPDHIAVIYNDTQWTYRQLNARANQLAHRLLSFGIGPESRVAILLDKSPEMIAAVLAVWKAGGAYVPVDPDYPAERIRYLLQDSAPEVLITDAATRERLQLEAFGRTIEVNDESLQEQSVLNLNVSRSLSDLAYVIYTSGTTGNPKGVMVEQRSYMSVTRAWQHAYRLKEMRASVLQLASFSFDVFAGDLSRTLFHGGTLVLCSNEIKMDPRSLYELLAQHQIRLFESTPALIIPLMNYIFDNKLPTDFLKLLILGSDSCTATDFQQLLDRFGAAMRIINSYGVTEACIDSSFYEDAGASLTDGNVPIGKPLENVSFYVIGQGDTIQPVNVAGELCIGGAGVARGYLNREELSAARFVPDPFRSGERMYRTGDLVKFRPDGNVEFIGRSDHQVKIKGYRIELGEIESALTRHEAVKEAVVLSRLDSGASAVLCAYAVAISEISAERLKQYLLSVLPSYMVPAYFMFMDKLPLTHNGKIDRKSLPNIQESFRKDRQFVPPRNDVEEKLVQVWREVLNFEKMGIADHFFECGGDSIKIMQVTSRLQRAGLRLDAKMIFQYPTIQQLGHYVAEDAGRQGPNQQTVIGESVLTPIQQWFFEREYMKATHWNQANMLVFKGKIDENLLRESLHALIVHHDALGSCFRMVDGNRKQCYKPLEERRLSVTSWDLTEMDDAAAQRSIEELNEKLHTGFDLEEGPLVAAHVYRTAGRDLVGLAIHHLVVDGVSWRILMEDLNTVYTRRMQGLSAAMPLKSDSFQTWAQALERYAASPGLQQQLSYWAGVERTDVERLRADYAADDNRHGRTRHYVLQLDEEYTSKLLYKTHQAYNTGMNDILLAALGLGLYDWQGYKTLAVDLEGHGRENIQEGIVVDRTVGWFTSVYPFILSHAGAEDMSYYIRSMKERIRQIPDNGIGYGVLKYMPPQDRPNPLPLRLKPELCFNYLGHFDSEDGNGPLGLTFESAGPFIAAENERDYAIEMNGMIQGSRLLFDIGYNGAEFPESSIERFGQCYAAALRRVVDHCASSQHSTRTPSDLGYGRMSLEDLDSLTSQLNFNI